VQLLKQSLLIAGEKVSEVERGFWRTVHTDLGRDVVGSDDKWVHRVAGRVKQDGGSAAVRSSSVYTPLGVAAQLFCLSRIAFQTMTYAAVP
jgi:hypothetical protein